MKFFAIVLLALIAAVAAFRPQSIKVQTRALSMKADSNNMKAAIPAAMIPFLAPVAAFAAEGTGRAFGIDDGRLIWAALAPSLIIFPLYLQWSSQQEGDDFFDGYEKRRNG
eukprot:gene14644-19674_t